MIEPVLLLIVLLLVYIAVFFLESEKHMEWLIYLLSAFILAELTMGFIHPFRIEMWELGTVYKGDPFSAIVEVYGYYPLSNESYSYPIQMDEYWGFGLIGRGVNNPWFFLVFADMILIGRYYMKRRARNEKMDKS